ncbi:MAG: PEP-CTERM sorting domain-containing protein [Gammaproteobacteria bacterium]|nr:MAG: PEP-CTERM sorting domain-containing protein [Gammaproteobacteria bacterium]
MMNRTKLVALLFAAGTLCASSMDYATPDHSMKETHNSGSSHEPSSGDEYSWPSNRQNSGDENMKNHNTDKLSHTTHRVIGENKNPATAGVEDRKIAAGKVIPNEQNFNSKPVPASAYLNDNSASSVPEPEIYAMLVAGLSLLGFIARHKKNSA